jgi:hypothetical protein
MRVREGRERGENLGRGPLFQLAKNIITHKPINQIRLHH